MQQTVFSVRLHTDNIEGMGECQDLFVRKHGGLLICTKNTICSRPPIWYRGCNNERVYTEHIQAIANCHGMLVHNNGTVVTCDAGTISKRMPELYIVAGTTDKEGYCQDIDNQVLFDRPVSIAQGPFLGNYIVVDSNNHALRLVGDKCYAGHFVGNCQKGFTDGKGREASFKFPTTHTHE
jgi:hypothetical protein